METWYLAVNCIDGDSLTTLVDAFISSPAVTNIWSKRNPLGSSAANGLFRLITQTPNLRTLDINQTGLGDAGVASLFTQLAEHGHKIPLKIIYMNGNGIGVSAADAIGRYLASDICSITWIYMSSNPLGSEGTTALASGLKGNCSLTRLALQSVGMSDVGAIHLFDALQSHPKIKVIDVGMSIATMDLGQAYNYLTDAVASHLGELIESAETLQYLRLDNCAMTIAGLNTVLKAVGKAPSILFFRANSIFPQARDYNSVKRGQEHARLHKLVGAHVMENIRARYDNDMTYENWIANEKRWVVSDEQDVRKIDSVYRNRDMGLARRGLKKLDKWWDEDDETLASVAIYPS
jgi:Ran GTPase-activating protein (RanGAP) involved in mRNA processing and transport